ncbi:acetyltransferase [Francisella sp. LA112445]|uniref:acetyltransferase n=1 Tax=Francisella sp. LA112445 TaxID=1395624 RepID=UPI001788C61C|nr:acetyltransferase [Francisella sp. LA112445]QIW11085.1 acetyltransferase [Francisella sp. LA112445]
MNKLLIIGAGGHGKVVYDIAESTKRFDEICFLDDAATGAFYKSEIIGSSLDVDKYKEECSFIVAVGSNAVRKKVQSRVVRDKLETIIHPTAIISDSAKIGKGTIIMSGVVVNADAKIGDGVIVNTASVIEHDSSIGDFCHISPNATICGTVNMAQNTWIGAGSTVINNINICADVVVGAGSVVVSDINNKGTYKSIIK